MKPGLQRSVPAQTRPPAGTPPTPPQHFRTRMRGYRVVWAIICFLALPMLWYGAVRTRSGQLMDTLSMNAVQEHMPLRTVPVRTLEVLVSVPTLVVIGVVLVAVTLLRRRLGLTVRAGLVFVAANVTTQVLKDFLPRPNMGIGHVLENSFPSGHVTAAASVVVVAIAVVPVGVRSLVAYVGAVFMALVGLAVVNVGWHRPSDVLGALIVVCFFALLMLPSEWIPSRPRIWSSLLAWLGVLILAASTIGFAFVARYLLGDPLIFGSGPVTASTLVAVAARANPGAYLTLISTGFIAGGSALLASAVDRLAGGAPR